MAFRPTSRAEALFLRQTRDHAMDERRQCRTSPHWAHPSRTYSSIHYAHLKTGHIASVQILLYHISPRPLHREKHEHRKKVRFLTGRRLPPSFVDQGTANAAECASEGAERCER